MWEKFEKLREERGLSAYQICKDLGEQPGMISNWKAGRYTPKRDKIQKIADYFGVPISYFYDDEEEPTYYIDEKTRETAEEIRTNKELKLLFDAARDASPEDLLTVHQMLLALKRKERHDD